MSSRSCEQVKREEREQKCADANLLEIWLQILCMVGIEEGYFRFSFISETTGISRSSRVRGPGIGLMDSRLVTGRRQLCHSPQFTCSHTFIALQGGKTPIRTGFQDSAVCSAIIWNWRKRFTCEIYLMCALFFFTWYVDSVQIYLRYSRRARPPTCGSAEESEWKLKLFQ